MEEIFLRPHGGQKFRKSKIVKIYFRNLDRHNLHKLRFKLIPFLHFFFKFFNNILKRNLTMLDFSSIKVSKKMYCPFRKALFGRFCDGTL